MKTQILKEEDIYKGNLVLINQSNPLQTPIMPNSLEPFSNQHTTTLINQQANKHLHQLLTYLQAYNQIVPVSGYRSLEEQKKIFDDSMKENGLDFTQQYVALPNTSEHQTGLAIDLGLNTDEIDFIRPSFPSYGISQQFRNCAPQYGFIERYQEEKKNITNISAEEWHFRYVGYPHSHLITQNHFCLEEYIEWLRKTKKKKICFQDYEISYLPFTNKELEIILNNQDQLSGNNIDGFILTRKKTKTPNIMK